MSHLYLFLFLQPVVKKMMMTTPGLTLYPLYPNSIPLVPPDSWISVIKHCTLPRKQNSGALLPFAWISVLSYFSFLLQFA